MMKRGSPTTNYTSYQQGTTGSKKKDLNYATTQTATLTDTTAHLITADDTAQKVLQQLTTQRQQIEGAHSNVYDMRQATEQVKRELQQLQQKYRQKKRYWYTVIGVLMLTDFLLFYRIVHCHGNFYCW